MRVYFTCELGYTIHGLDNNQRAVFFGPQGDTCWNQHRLLRELPGFTRHELGIRDAVSAAFSHRSESFRRGTAGFLSYLRCNLEGHENKVLGTEKIGCATTSTRSMWPGRVRGCIAGPRGLQSGRREKQQHVHHGSG